jgi:2'-5' RNA ligase
MGQVKNSLRLFISVELPDFAKEVLLDTQDTIRENCGQENFRFLPEENMHLTLLFLGECLQSDIIEIEEIMAEACDDFSSGEFLISGAGMFSTKGEPRVVWAGVEDEDKNLKKIHNRIKRPLLEHGLEFETRKFKPHLTLAYIKKLNEIQTQALVTLLPELLREPLPVSYNTISLKWSKLNPGGAIHETLTSVEL